MAESPNPSPRTMVARLKRIAFLAALVGVGLVVVLYVMVCTILYRQQNEITYPAQGMRGMSPEAIARKAPKGGLVPWEHTTPGAASPQGFVAPDFEITKRSDSAAIPPDQHEQAEKAAIDFKQGHFDDAAAAYQAMIKAHPDSLYAWSNLGVARFQQGQYEEARKAVQQALVLAPDDVANHQSLSLIYQQLGQAEDAKIELQKAAALEQEDRAAKNAGSTPSETPRGTIVLFHGNGAWATHQAFYVPIFKARGFRTFLYEYPGFGARPGHPSEATIVPDGRALIRSLDAAGYGPIYVWGESLGSGVASAVCGDPTLPVHGLVILTAWDNIANVGLYRYPYIPVRQLMIDKYDSIANLAHFGHPICVVRSTLDEVIPPALTLNLFAHLPEPKKLIVQEGAGHDDWPHEANAAWWDEALNFIAPK